MESSSSIMTAYFTNHSCDPFNGPDAPCNFGNYVRYSVNVTNAAQISTTLKFAQVNNIRIVIRNTGHDYLGRSTGAGSLAIWTHHLKSIKFNLEYSDGTYSGPAATFGAGVQGFEAIAAARDHGLVVLTGECPTVGIVGGYTQGGGHSALSTNYGLSADNVLEFEVVTASGDVVVANARMNQDLFWALRGGGPGNYGVVTSMTVKAFPDKTVSGAFVYFSTDQNSVENFFAAVDAFHGVLPEIIDAGTMALYALTSAVSGLGEKISSFDGKKQIFELKVTAYGQSAADVEKIIAPFLSALAQHSIVYTNYTTEFQTYYEHYNQYFGPLPYGTVDQLIVSTPGGRLIPRDTFTHNLTALNAMARRIVTQYPTILYIGMAMNVSRHAGEFAAVNPAWRRALVHTIAQPLWLEDPQYWETNSASQDAITNDIVPAFEALAPNSGAYVNEGDFRQPNFQEVFYGKNYPALYLIKKSRDPKGLFYVNKGVGSEDWTVNGDGQLCYSG
ncbi:hypothetical protein HDU83_003909 [Entophlyctis luteolus]|nr:hypothetical protein HDU83_003909 [Entophlyctis luteolus]